VTIPPGLLARQRELRQARQAYATVTVVWSSPPVSGKPGNAALVSADGHLEGWVGGSCAEPVVVREALAALAEGSPRLVYVGTTDEPGPPRDGVVQVPTSCAGEGSVEVFVEPHLPPARLVVVGRAPVVRALASMARVLGFEVCVIELEEAAEPWPEGVELRR
jgi:xanthine dehydrogenase accessory factor